MRFRVRYNDQEEGIEVNRRGDNLRISYKDRSFEARLIHTDGAHFVLEVDDIGPDGFVSRRRIRAAGHSDGDKRQLWANGRLVTYQRIQEGEQGESDIGAGSLSATIPAIVSETLVEIGAKVKAGDRLILLESMKMILPIQAPHEGIVSAINCSPGEAVEPGVQLIELENFLWL